MLCSWGRMMISTILNVYILQVYKRKNEKGERRMKKETHTIAFYYGWRLIDMHRVVAWKL
jgi:hypothetical protein